MKLDQFNKLHGFFIQDLKVGQEAILSKTITEADITNFSGVTGDNNPVHISDDFASKTIFKKRVAHGFFTASLISTLIATKLPGPGSIYISQTLKFLAPAYIGDNILTRVIIQKIDKEKRRVNLLTECFISDKKILTGEAEILVDKKSE
ncbi:MAG: (R)-specific enoyl-CoA hydratase [Alphaproteobacteria bacterium MarineAlpha8_Bin1]|nr:MAG: (R)-specific enoyl-CoA hydratase [Alphaproteobacteria bacterium MarineAlpha8_Bin1]|tara:strand:- start:2623 stop:3069 length:447 start_codon:yes stop_codon:yes gene_type:complete